MRIRSSGRKKDIFRLIPLGPVLGTYGTSTEEPMPILVTLTCDLCALLRMDRRVYISVVDPDPEVLAGSGSGNIVPNPGSSGSEININ